MSPKEFLATSSRISIQSLCEKVNTFCCSAEVRRVCSRGIRKSDIRKAWENSRSCSRLPQCRFTPVADCHVALLNGLCLADFSQVKHCRRRGMCFTRSVCVSYSRTDKSSHRARLTHYFLRMAHETLCLFVLRIKKQNRQNVVFIAISSANQQISRISTCRTDPTSICNTGASTTEALLTRSLGKFCSTGDVRSGGHLALEGSPWRLNIYGLSADITVYFSDASC